jgi:Ca-activated chloride channel family protein
MKTALRIRSCRNKVLAAAVAALLPVSAFAATQLVLSRDANVTGEYKGLVDLAVVPGVSNAVVSVTIDGQKVVDGLHAPFHASIDLGPTLVEHKISITAVTPDKKKIQWRETINRGRKPLSITLRPVDLPNRVFEAVVTAPEEDPVIAIEFWDAGQLIGSASTAPYRFTVPAEHFEQQFVQVTAKSKSGDEAADFWSGSGDVHVESVEVRTVPIFVSVVDRNGNTRDDIDRSLFRVLDNGAEAKIIEFGKAFDQPISIAVVLDASSSMTYTMDDANGAALGFVKRTLKQGDHCTVFSVRDTPKREIALTTDRVAVEKALNGIKARGRTSLYDAIGSAIRELKDEKNRRAIVVLTDGGDTSSILSFDEVDRTAQEAGIPIYFIVYDSGMPTEPQEIARLTYLAGETGGFVATASAQNLQAKYGDIEKDLRAQYAIRYQISDFAKRNEWRKVRVVLSSPKLTARTIGGYFAP